MSAWAIIASTTKASLARQKAAYPRSFEGLELDSTLAVNDLELFYPFGDVLRDLEDAGCSAPTVAFLSSVFDQAVRSLRQRSQEAFNRSIRGIASTFSDSSTTLKQTQRILSDKYVRDFQATVDRFREGILAEVMARKAEVQAATTNERGVFSDEATTILHAVYERQTNVSRREKQALSERTGLSLAQIATWFSNRRARPERYPRNARPSALPYPNARPNAVAVAPRRLSLRTFSNFSNTSTESDDSLAPSAASFDRDASSDRENAPSPPSVPQYDVYANEQQHFPPLHRVVYSDWDESESPYSSSGDEDPTSRRGSSSPSPPSHFDLYFPSTSAPHFLLLHATPTPALASPSPQPSSYSESTSAFRDPYHDPSIALSSAQTNSSPPISPDVLSDSPFPPTNFFQGIELDLGAYDASFWRGVFDSNDAISNGALEMDMPGSMGAPLVRVVDVDLEGEEDTEMGEGVGRM